MVFAAGSRIAAALDATCKESRLKLDTAFGKGSSAMSDDDTKADAAGVGTAGMPPDGPAPTGLDDEHTLPTPPSAAASSDPAPGAHLQLPSIDFALPDFAKGAPAPSASGSPSPAASLPAHLQLPSFPDFQLPPIPDASGGIPSGELALKAAAPSAAPSGLPGSPEPWSIASVSSPGAVLPPPMRPPPPPKTRPKPAPAAATPSGGLSDLPALGLPTLTSAQKPKDPTLLQSDAAMQMVADMQHKKMSLPVLIAGLLLIVAAAGAGVLWYYGPSTVLSWFRDPSLQKVSKSDQDKANEAFVEGVKAYKAEKLPDAVTLFSKAVRLDPRHADAHRSLGIAYAKSNQPKQAVQHYRTYLKLAPAAPDAATVRKFIEDYDKAQEKGKDGKKK